MPQTLAGYAQLHYSLGSETAFVYRRGFRTHKWSYRQTAELAFRFARELEARGIGKGDRVMLWGENCAEWVAAFFGCMLRGTVAVPMDKIAAPEFANRVASDVDAKLLICSSHLVAQVVGKPTMDLESLSEALQHHSAAPYQAASITRIDPAQIIFTSGTTAEPRGVVLTHGNILTSVDPIEREIPKYRKYERIFHPIRFLHMLPLSHVFGQTMGMLIPPVIAGTVFFQDSYKPSEVLETIRRNRISVLSAVPRVVESLKTKMEAEFGDAIRAGWGKAENAKFLTRWWHFRTIHRYLGWKFWAIISGGAALDQNTEEFWRRLGYGVIQGYGLTETSSLVSLNHPFKIGRRSIGKVLPGREMKLDAETGEILVRGDNVMQGYWNDPEATARTLVDGWLHTGDIGVLDDDGYLRITDRKRDFIKNSGGEMISPMHVEAALTLAPEIAQAMVFGDRRPYLVAVIVPDPDFAKAYAEGQDAPVTLDALAEDPGFHRSLGHIVERVNAGLAAAERVRRFVIAPEPFSLANAQLTPTLKIRRHAIREAYALAFDSLYDGKGMAAD